MRVNQSHSIKVDAELKELEPPKFLYYGTDEKYLVDILQMGIIKKSRLYVHLSETIETAINVGKRHGIPKVLIIVQAQKMFQDGYKFYLSENNVWLTDNVPKEYVWVGV